METIISLFAVGTVTSHFALWTSSRAESHRHYKGTFTPVRIVGVYTGALQACKSNISASFSEGPSEPKWGGSGDVGSTKALIGP